MPCRASAHGDSGSESDGEEINRWNLRKCSAAGLDVLSTVFGDEMLPIVIPIVKQRLQVGHSAMPACMCRLVCMRGCGWAWIDIAWLHAHLLVNACLSSDGRVLACKC